MKQPPPWPFVRHLTLARAIAAAAALVPAQASTARAQPPASDRWTVGAVVSGNANAATPSDPFVVVDVTGTGRVRDGLDVIVRPWAARRNGGDWTAMLYQLQLRYAPPTRLPVRIDAGIIASPLGLNTLELIADTNPTISAPFFYFAPLPRFDARFEGVQLMSGGYPVGAVVSSSGSKWDARVGVTDQSPTRRRNALAGDRPPGAAQLVAGGGYTPTQGLRIGASAATGPYRRAAAATGTSPAADGTDATVFSVEGEYAFGYSRVTGEWIRDAFDTAGRPAVARGFSVMAMRTLSPRWFAAARVSRVSAPAYLAPDVAVRRVSSAGQATLGYRLNTDVTLRGGWQLSQRYGASDRTHALMMSAVWARRWR